MISDLMVVFNVKTLPATSQKWSATSQKRLAAYQTSVKTLIFLIFFVNLKKIHYFCKI